MNRTIYIYDQKECIKISRQVITSDGLPVEYKPIYIIDKSTFDLTTFSDSIFKSSETSGITIKTLSFGTHPDNYKEYKKEILKELQENSFNQLAKKSNLFILEWSENNITIMPTSFSKQGHEGIETDYKKISIYGKLKTQISQEIIDFINQYKKDDS